MNAPGLVATMPYDKPRNDYAQAWLAWEEFGFWSKQSSKIIPLHEIEIPPPWSQVKLRDNVEWIDKTKKTRPIRISKGREEAKYVISDGIHRCNAAKQLGYDAIPAIVSTEMYTSPPPAKGVEKLREERAGWSLYQLIKREYPGTLDWGNVKEDGKNFILVIERNDTDQEFHWEVKYSFVNGAFDGAVSGASSGNVKGTLEQVATEIARIMSQAKEKTAASRMVADWLRKGIAHEQEKSAASGNT